MSQLAPSRCPHQLSGPPPTPREPFSPPRAWGTTPEIAQTRSYPRELEAANESMKAMRRRGIRILPGGDYGFAWTPHGTNAKDLEYFVKYIGMSPMEALLSATAWGGPMMKMGKQLGYIREGCLADILLIDGDPLADITVLQDKARILAVMKDGEFHRAPPVRHARTTRWAA